MVRMDGINFLIAARVTVASQQQAAKWIKYIDLPNT